MLKWLAAVTLSLLVATDCMAGSPPKPEQSEFLTTTAGYFILARGEGVKFSVAFELRKQITAPIYATVSFENPDALEPPLVVRTTLEPSQHELKLDSPNIPRIKNDTAYSVEVLLFSDKARTKRIGRHVQPILFNMPPDVLRSFGIQLL